MKLRVGPALAVACMALAIAGCGAHSAGQRHHGQPKSRATSAETLSSQPTQTTTVSPAPPINPMQPQDGGVSAALAYLSGATNLKQIKVVGGTVISTPRPDSITALFASDATGKWVALPLPFAVNTFERETQGGGLLFLSQGPMDDGPYSPFPFQELAIPQPDGTFKAEKGPACFPVSREGIGFGSKHGESLQGAEISAQGIRFTFGDLQYADFLSIPATTVRYDSRQGALSLDFADTTLGSVSGLPALHSQYIEGVFAKSAGSGVIVTISLSPQARYYTGAINTPPETGVFLELDFASSPPAAPWGP